MAPSIALVSFLPDAGHVRPLLRIAEAFSRRGYDIVCYLPKECETYLHGYRFRFVSLDVTPPVARLTAPTAGAILSAVFVIAAVVSLFAHQDPVTWSTATGSGAASDVITRQEAVTSIGFLVAAVAVAALTPRDGTPRRAT